MPTVKYMAPTATAITRGNGHKACAAAAYRSASRIEDVKYNCVHNYEAKRGVLHSEIALPEGAPAWMQNREALWNAVESREDMSTRRGSAQVAKEYMCQLPRELKQDRQIAVMREWAGKLSERGLVADWSLHKAAASDGFDNPHAHVMVVTREIDPKNLFGFGAKWKGDPSIGTGGRAKSPLDDDKTLLRFKEEYTEIVNKHLKESGSRVRITHLSNEARGIDAEPGVHKGKHATALEKKLQQKGEPLYLTEHNTKVGYRNWMRPYKTEAEKKESWEKRVAEWQLLRGAAMAARDATQKNQSNVAAPTQDRSESRTNKVRQAALLAYKQTASYEQRRDKSTPDGPEMSR